MITKPTQIQYYQALLSRNSEYEGIFFVGVKTTGVFCRPTCPARKPKFEHCEFFETAEQALLASFRPCRRCKPLSYPQHSSELVEKLIQAVEENPEKHWRERDFKALFSVDASTARRQFKKRFGMTFVAYARARRMGLAMKQIKGGQPVIDAQLASGYESSSGFRDAFSRIMGAAPSLHGQCQILKAAWLDTPLGPMIAIADENSLYLLEFVDRRGLEREVLRLRQKIHAAIIPGHTEIIHSITQELKDYFAGKLQTFKTSLHLLGSPFQQRVWDALQNIPYGETYSYADLAHTIGQRTAFRAVANANGANQIAIVIPCHRVINTNGQLGGYGGGLTRKEWLIRHEKNHV
jgi:AraC family transcriptional regulator, regulatory protein of adaptative response / methylated-DNA-[protein]-cysteine methyltransferase